MIYRIYHCVGADYIVDQRIGHISIRSRETFQYPVSAAPGPEALQKRVVHDVIEKELGES